MRVYEYFKHVSRLSADVCANSLNWIKHLLFLLQKYRTTDILSSVESPKVSLKREGGNFEGVKGSPPPPKIVLAPRNISPCNPPNFVIHIAIVSHHKRCAKLLRAVLKI